MARIASATLHISNSDISCISEENITGFLKIGKTSLYNIFSLGKSL